MIFEQEAKIYKDNAIQEALDDLEASATQFTWHTETDTGAGAGTHITAIPKDDFLADPDNGGYNSLFDNVSMKIRNGLRTLARYGVSMIIGEDDGARVEVDRDTIRALTEDGVEAFSVESSTQALAQFVTKQVAGTVIQPNATGTKDISYLSNAVANKLVRIKYFYQYTPQGKNYQNGGEVYVDFVKGVSSTEQVTFTDYIDNVATTINVSIAYDSANLFTIDNGSRYYGNINSVGYYEQAVPIPQTNFNGLFNLNGVNFEQPTLDTTTIVPYSSRCNIIDGGIWRFGKWRFVQINVQINDITLAANNTWGILDGLANDLPATYGRDTSNNLVKMANLSASAQRNAGDISAYINGNGRIVVATSDQALTVNNVVMISGFYIAE